MGRRFRRSEFQNTPQLKRARDMYERIIRRDGIVTMSAWKWHELVVDEGTMRVDYSEGDTNSKMGLIG